VEPAPFAVLAFAALAFAVEPAVALTVELVDAATPVLATVLEAAAAAGLAAAAVVFVVVLAAVLVSLAAPFDCETAWVKACSNAVNKLFPLMLLPPAAPADPE